MKPVVVLLLAGSVLLGALWFFADGSPRERSSPAAEEAHGPAEPAREPAAPVVDREPTPDRIAVPDGPGADCDLTIRLVDAEGTAIDTREESTWLQVLAIDAGTPVAEPVFASTAFRGESVVLPSGRPYLVVSGTDRRPAARERVLVPRDREALEVRLALGEPRDMVELGLVFVSACEPFETELLVSVWQDEVCLSREALTVLLGGEVDEEEPQSSLDLFPGSYRIRVEPTEEDAWGPDGSERLLPARRDVQLRSEDEEESQLVVFELAVAPR